MSSDQPSYPRLGRYEVINRIAAGGMAEVFLARATGAMGFQKHVALKLIHDNFTRDKDFINMFIDEARIAMHLQHRNIVQVLDLEQIGETYFLAMEYVHGVNIYDVYEKLAERGRWFDVPLALYLIAEICKGLHFAHTRIRPNGEPMKIVHRDISPQNVLLSFEGEVKITDFGIAVATERLHQTAAGIVKGKYAYMAPERLEEKPSDARVDVFGAGVLLYELLTGENPFAGATTVETIENVLKKPIPMPSERTSGIPSSLDAICLRALARNPAERFPDAQAFSDAVTEQAMSLSHARKDMAAGDASIAQLLEQLFPHRKQQPLAIDPRLINLPIAQAPEIQDTDPVSGAPEAGRDPVHDTQDDVDAPTLLRMEPVHAEPKTDSDLATLPPGIDPAQAAATDEAAPAYPATIPAMGTDATLATQLRLDPPEQAIDSAERTQDTDPPTQARLTPIISEAVSAGRNDTAERRALQSHDETGPTQLPGVQWPTPSGPGSSASNMVVPLQSQDLPIPREPAKRASILAPLLGVAVVAVVVFLGLTLWPRFQKPEVFLHAVETTPPGAKIFINGVLERQPSSVEFHEGRSYHIRGTLKGFEDSELIFRPAAQAAHTIKLAPLEALLGSVNVIPDPPDAHVFLGEKDLGQGTKTIQDMTLDAPFTIAVRRKGYEDYIEIVTLSPDIRVKELRPALRKARRGRRAAVTPVRVVRFEAVNAAGRWATVQYKGRFVGTIGKEKTDPVSVPVGTVDLRLVNEESGLDRTVRVDVPATGSDVVGIPF